MKALVLSECGLVPKLDLVDVPTPSPGSGEVLVKVEACGFCHHDYLVMSGRLRRGVKDSVILGHEISGTIVTLGENVSSVSLGDRVVTLLTNSCGRCDRCRQGREHRCFYGKGIGHGCDGGFAEFVVVSEFSVVVIGGLASFSEAALLACPIGVVIRGVKEVAKVSEGESIVVTGAGGGLGVHAVQVAVALGAEVYAVTSAPEKVAFLEDLGAAQVLETGLKLGYSGGESISLDASQAIGELVRFYTNEKGADVVIDTVGTPLFNVSLNSLAQYGRIVCLGQVSSQNVSFNPAEMIFLDAHLFGCSGCSRSDVAYAINMVEHGQMKPVIHTELPLKHWEYAFNSLRHSQSIGRVVFTMG